MISKPFSALLSTALLATALTATALVSAPSLFAQQPVPPPGQPAGSPTPPPGSQAPPPPSSRRYPRQDSPQMARDFRGGGGPGRGEMGMGMHPGSRIVPPGEWWKNPDIIQRLTLTDDQQKKMDAIFQQSRLQLIDLKANLEKQEVILEPMLNANPPDSAKALIQIGKVADARADLEKANARMLLGIRSVLTAGQWTELQTRDRGPRSMMSHGKDGPGGPGGTGGRMGDLER